MNPIFFAARFQGTVSFLGTRLCCIGYDQPDGGSLLMTQEQLARTYRIFTGKPLWP